MLFVTTLDVHRLDDRRNTERFSTRWVSSARPAAGIFLHLTTTTDFGYRIVEIWNSKEGFEEFLEKRLVPASKAIGLDRKTDISITPLHNFFAPRLEELPAHINSLPGALKTTSAVLQVNLFEIGEGGYAKRASDRLHQ